MNSVSDFFKKTFWLYLITGSVLLGSLPALITLQLTSSEGDSRINQVVMAQGLVLLPAILGLSYFFTYKLHRQAIEKWYYAGFFTYFVMIIGWVWVFLGKMLLSDVDGVLLSVFVLAVVSLIPWIAQKEYRRNVSKLYRKS